MEIQCYPVDDLEKVICISEIPDHGIKKGDVVKARRSSIYSLTIHMNAETIDVNKEHFRPLTTWEKIVYFNK